jgi:hypothetical protein
MSKKEKGKTPGSKNAGPLKMDAIQDVRLNSGKPEEQNSCNGILLEIECQS